MKGPKGEIVREFVSQIAVSVEEQDKDGKAVIVRRRSEEREARALHGLVRNEIANMILGVETGYEKVLEISGVGFRAAVSGRKIVLNVGFSHPVEFELPKGVEASVDKQTIVTIKGIDRYLVGETAARVRAVRPPEPYKGKGIKYRDEVVRRKEGKTGK